MKQYKKKLIEVALPLEDINRESAREKSIRHGHPSTLHLWWARRPLAACRAVLFAQLVDDPSAHPDKYPTEEAQNEEREKLFDIIRRLVVWENINDENVLNEARQKILESTDGDPPPVYDPFCGGGSIPLEAQRLGLKAYASDLNPVAVLITKALIEIPPKFADRPPVNPEATRKSMNTYSGAQGLAEDVRYYGKWMRDQAEKRIGHLYPKVKLSNGREATVIAWLWARTVKCPNPACGAMMPLASKFWLSKKKNRKAWVEPIIEPGNPPKVRFEVRTGNGEPMEPPKVGRGAKFKCLCCGHATTDKYIKKEGIEKRLNSQLIAIVAEGDKGRVYLPPNKYHNDIAKNVEPSWFPEEELPYEPRAIWCTLYGLRQYKDLFTPRQLVALTTFSDLVKEAREKVLEDAIKAGMPGDCKGIASGGTGAQAYADAIATYLAFAVDKGADFWSVICSWSTNRYTIKNTFALQAIPMVWDYAESNPFSNSTGSINSFFLYIPLVVQNININSQRLSYSDINDISTKAIEKNVIFSTDPPYYDNIGYADLSDYFYIWLRKSLLEIYPELFNTMMTPKASELVATPYRFEGNKDKAKIFFENGLRKFFKIIYDNHCLDYPATIYYAFKQAEIEKDGHIASTGWETMLEGLISTGFSITGTWPMRTERPTGMKFNVNALASSIVIVCRHRSKDAPMATRREFLSALKAELPPALRMLQLGNIAPVDLAQAAIGPGMSIYSRYSKILESDGTAMTVRTALQLINQALDEFLAEQEGEYDSDTRWALAWFGQFGVNEAEYGVAETLAKAKNTSVQGLVDAGILEAKAGKVRLLMREEMAAGWDPEKDKRFTIWEAVQYLIIALDKHGEEGAARLLKKLGGEGDSARDLSYRLYIICERKKWAQEALAYNSLVVAWPSISSIASRKTYGEPIRLE